MTVELRGPGRTMQVSGSVWRRLLRLARDYGWRPAGTANPLTCDPPFIRSPSEEQIADWDGNYDSRCCQRVGCADAQALAAALHSAYVACVSQPQITEDWAESDDEVDVAELFTVANFALSGAFRIT